MKKYVQHCCFDIITEKGSAVSVKCFPNVDLKLRKEFNEISSYYYLVNTKIGTILLIFLVKYQRLKNVAQKRYNLKLNITY